MRAANQVIGEIKKRKKKKQSCAGALACLVVHGDDRALVCSRISVKAFLFMEAPMSVAVVIVPGSPTELT